MMAASQREAAERLAAATDEYERLAGQARQQLLDGDSKAAAKLARKAIELDPQRSEAHYALAASYGSSGDYLRASECYLSVMERDAPDSEPWAQAVFYAWDQRSRAAPCGSNYAMCGSECCAALPAKPAWMASPQALVAMAERVVAARPGNAMSWDMHASAHRNIQSWPTTSKSYAKAARLYGDDGDEPNKVEMLGIAAREYAEEDAKAAAEAEAARMAPIMAARVAAADAAREALLAEEEQEKAAAAATKRKPSKGKGKGKGKGKK